jgi:hypothetical protein
MIATEGGVLVIGKNDELLCASDSTGETFGSVGTYVVYENIRINTGNPNNIIYHLIYISEIVTETIHPIDPKYIPSSTPSIQTSSTGDTVVVKSVDENGKPIEWETKSVEEIGNEYNESQDLPYTERINPVTFDGNMEGKTYLSDLFLVKVSDNFVDLTKAVRFTQRKNNGEYATAELDESNTMTEGGGVRIEYNNMTAALSIPNGSILHMEFGECGTFVFAIEDSWLSKIEFAETVHLIDTKYIPASTPNIQSSSSGKIVAVDSVDDNGTPLSWKTVDLQTPVENIANEVSKINFRIDENDILQPKQKLDSELTYISNIKKESMSYADWKSEFSGLGHEEYSLIFNKYNQTKKFDYNFDIVNTFITSKSPIFKLTAPKKLPSIKTTTALYKVTDSSHDEFTITYLYEDEANMSAISFSGGNVFMSSTFPLLKYKYDTMEQVLYIFDTITYGSLTLNKGWYVFLSDGTAVQIDVDEYPILFTIDEIEENKLDDYIYNLFEPYSFSTKIESDNIIIGKDGNMYVLPIKLNNVISSPCNASIGLFLCMR